MAVIKSVSSRASIGHAINYITQKEKTLDKLISGIECNPRTAINEMKATKRIWDKTDGRQYKHYIQSWHPDDKDKLTVEQAHALTVELCKDRFKGFEVVIATHKDRNHIHSHIVVNSVSYETGHKIQTDNKFLADMKRDSNEQSRRLGLTIPEKKKEAPGINKQGKFRAVERAKEGNYKSWLHEIYAAVKNALGISTDRQSFINEVGKAGIKTEWIDTRKHITFTDAEGNKARASNLAKTFGAAELAEKDSIINALQANREKKTEKPPVEITQAAPEQRKTVPEKPQKPPGTHPAPQRAAAPPVLEDKIREMLIRRGLLVPDNTPLRQPADAPAAESLPHPERKATGRHDTASEDNIMRMLQEKGMLRDPKYPKTAAIAGKNAVLEQPERIPAEISPTETAQIAPEQRKTAPEKPQNVPETISEPPRVVTPPEPVKTKTKTEYEKEIAKRKEAAAAPPFSPIAPIDKEQERLLAEYKRHLNEELKIRKEYKTELTELSAAYQLRREWRPILKERPKDNRFWKRDEYDKANGITPDVIKDYKDAGVTIDNFFMYRDIKREDFKLNKEIANNDIRINKIEDLITKVDEGKIRIKPPEQSLWDKAQKEHEAYMREYVPPVKTNTKDKNKGIGD